VTVGDRDAEASEGDPDALKRQLRLLALRVAVGVLAWIVLVAALTWRQVDSEIHDQVADLAERTTQYRDSAIDLVSQKHAEFSRMASILAEKPELVAVAGRYGAEGESFSGATRDDRRRRLRADPQVALANEVLADTVKDLRYELIYVLDGHGITVAASDWNAAVTPFGESYRDRAYFRDAMAGGSGEVFVVGRARRTGGFYFSARIEGPAEPHGVVVARLPSDGFVKILSRRRYEFLLLDRAGMVVASSNPRFLLNHATVLGELPPNAETLRSIYALDSVVPLPLERPEQPLHDIHWRLAGAPHLLSIGDVTGTAYRVAILSRFREATDIRHEYNLFGGLVALIGVPVGVAIFLVLAGHARSRESARQLAAANVRLAAVNEEKNRYLGVAAHDLRNPLSSVRGLSQLMLEMPLPPEQQREFVATIHRTSAEMLGLVNDLLDVATIEAGRLDLKTEAADLAALVRERLVHLEPLAGRKSIAVDFAAGEAPARIDRARFGQVVDNLVSNAIKFSPPGTAVRIRVDADAGVARLAVEDRGPGISEEDRPRLFGKFVKLTARPTAGESSTGLGLSIVRKVVDAHGGTIAVESAEGGGARFVVNLPAGSPAAHMEGDGDG
jgi:signal transduction histidine kinase